jgi:beta-galactosidase
VAECAIRRGRNHVAIARKNGKEVARHQLETTGKAVALKMEAENNDFKAQRNGLEIRESICGGQ